MENHLKNNKHFYSDFPLPIKLQRSEEGKIVLALLHSHLKPVKPGFEIMFPSFAVSESLLDALNFAWRTGRLVRGLDDAESKLAAERKGIEHSDMKTGTVRTDRISRVVVIANDGSDRFYRQTRKIVEQNRPRVMAIHLDITSFELGERLFGPGKRALFLLINHKDAVINFLLSLIDYSAKKV